jgi:hypothetical protein
MNGGPGKGKIIRIAPAMSRLAERIAWSYHDVLRMRPMKNYRAGYEAAFNSHGDEPLQYIRDDSIRCSHQT